MCLQLQGDDRGEAGGCLPSPQQHHTPMRLLVSASLHVSSLSMAHKSMSIYSSSYLFQVPDPKDSMMTIQAGSCQQADDHLVERADVAQITRCHNDMTQMLEAL